MIKIIEEIKDYAKDRYWDYIMDKEINTKDPNYFGETSDRIAEDLYDFFNGLIAEEILTESWVSNSNMKFHFRKHCVGKNNKKSEKKYIRYDFTTVDKFEKYEDTISDKVLNPDIKIVSLGNTVKVFSALSKVIKQPTSILFDTPCGFENEYGSFKIGLNSFANDVTTNFPSANTINLMILSNVNETISMYAINVDIIENKFKSLVKNYIDDKNIKKLYESLR